MRRLSEGAELNLSSHVLDASDGSVILFDGPRAKPCMGAEGNLAVLPLSIPEAQGRYSIQIEPVVETRFWAADRGFIPAKLEAERMADGALHVRDPGPRHEFVLGRNNESFHIDTPLYGLGDSERCVEIPWVLSRYRGERRVLDTGYANAEPRHVKARNALNIPFSAGLDLAGAPQAGICGVTGDILASPFGPGSFDVIFAVSVIEHVGRDNSIYSGRKDARNCEGDIDAARSLARLLTIGGRLLVTVPFGILEDHGWFIQYDDQRLRAMIAATGCESSRVEHFVYDQDGWRGPVDPVSLSRVTYRDGHGAGAVACMEISRTHSSR